MSTVTTEHAYDLLCEEGYAQARERSGYFVIFKRSDGFAASGGKSSEPAQEKHLGHSKPFFPYHCSAGLCERLSRTGRTRYSNARRTKGLMELRDALRQYLARNRGINVDAEQIVVGSGAEYLCGLIVDLLGREKTYAIESPSYEKIEHVYRAAGVRYELLPLSDDGIDGAALSGSGADILHTTPYRSFPTGVTASASKRYEYICWAEKGGRFIVESDYDSEFSVSQKPADTLFALSEQDNVIYLNTFSKTISPSMRVGYMVLPKRLVKTFEERLGFYSCTVPTFEQLVLTELLNSGDFERHINRVRRAKRRELNKT